MEVVEGLPPNWRDVKQLTPPEDAIFCYGDKIYNPTGKEIPEDIIRHESIHSVRQAEHISPNAWWLKYIHDPHFRLNEEVIAYAHQYAFIKKHYPSRAHKDALQEMATNLSSMYRLPITYPQAETMIRKRAKSIIY